MQGRALLPRRERSRSTQQGIKRLFRSSRIGRAIFQPDPKPKKPHLQEKDMPEAWSQTWMMGMMHAAGETRRRMARERREAGSSVVSIETLNYKTIN